MKKWSQLFAVAAILSGCGAATGGMDSTGLAGRPTNLLWIDQATTSSPLMLAKVEAELGARGETTSGIWHLGEKTAVAYGKKLYSREGLGNDVGGGKDCSDFPSSAAAQRFFLSEGGPVRDPHNLDGDGDGLACEWGKTISQIHRKASYKPKATPTKRYRSYRSSSRCYVGPRGGTYTITASGNKNYGGC